MAQQNAAPFTSEVGGCLRSALEGKEGGTNGVRAALSYWNRSETGSPNVHRGGHDSSPLRTESSAATVSGHHSRASVCFDRTPESQHSER